MGSLFVIMAKPALDAHFCFFHRFKIVKVDAFVLQGSPEPFNENIVPPASLSVHRNLNPVYLESINELKSRELAPLIRIEDFGRPISIKSLLQRV